LSASPAGAPVIALELHMKSWGVTFLIFGIGSCILHALGMEFIILSWINGWGEEIGWGIRGAVALVGAIMLGVGASQERKQSA